MNKSDVIMILMVLFLVLFGFYVRHEAAPEQLTGPQCTLVYPRGFEYSRGPKDGPDCGDLAVSWRVCVPTWEI